MKFEASRAGVEFRAISIDGTLDPGDAAAITASGQLHLRLSKDSYQKVGLLGSKSKGNKGKCYLMKLLLPPSPCLKPCTRFPACILGATILIAKEGGGGGEMIHEGQLDFKVE